MLHVIPIVIINHNLVGYIMKNVIIGCTIAICSIMCAVGYFIACTCNSGPYSSPLSYLDIKDSVILIFLLVTAVASIFSALKTKKN